MATLEDFRRAYEIIVRGPNPNPPLVISHGEYEAMLVWGIKIDPIGAGTEGLQVGACEGEGR